jgi:hypothetical protein
VEEVMEVKLAHIRKTGKGQCAEVQRKAPQSPPPLELLDEESELDPIRRACRRRGGVERRLNSLGASSSAPGVLASIIQQYSDAHYAYEKDNNNII